MARTFILALLVAAVLAPASPAQMRGGFRGSARGARGFGASFSGRHRSGFLSGYFLGDTPLFYDDYPFAPAMPEPAAPQVIVIQQPAVADAPPAKAVPLLIELQGNRYVRYGGVAQSSQSDQPAREMPGREPMATSNSAEAPSSRSADLPSADLAPTVLVYRDGHREEVPDYAIVGRVIYAHNSNDEQIGYGLKNIQLSTLDIPATIRANRENGVSFVLPTGPNEVVTRP